MLYRLWQKDQLLKIKLLKLGLLTMKKWEINDAVRLSLQPKQLLDLSDLCMTTYLPVSPGKQINRVTLCAQVTTRTLSHGYKEQFAAPVSIWNQLNVRSRSSKMLQWNCSISTGRELNYSSMNILLQSLWRMNLSWNLFLAVIRSNNSAGARNTFLSLLLIRYTWTLPETIPYR